MPGVIHVLDPYCYRCPFGWTRETCHRECITHVEEVIRLEGPESIAAVLFEGVTGSNGILVPPDEYWPRIREICDKYGILLISDEVMSGFGRTGKWFAVDHWGVVPDIITMAKGITSGYVPLGAVVVSEPIAQFFEERTLWAGLTYSGHALACAAGLATLQVYEEDRLIENAAAMGRVLGQRLEDLKARHPSVGDVRYIGLFSVIEVVKDKATKEPMAPWNAKASEMGAMAKVAAFLRANGLYTFVRWNWIFVVPPLCITEAQLDEGLGIIDRALEIADAACA
jgi:taurine--2-oxoglutarate transaminase